MTAKHERDDVISVVQVFTKENTDPDPVNWQRESGSGQSSDKPPDDREH
jgi:hypothetical protein